MKDAQHPIWPIVRMLIVAFVMCFMFVVGAGYKNEFDLSTDGWTIGAVLGAMGGVDAVKGLLTRGISNG